MQIPELALAVPPSRASFDAIRPETSSPATSDAEVPVEVVPSDGETDLQAALAQRLTRAIDRVVHDAMRPLVRGNNGLDRESRAELRQLRRDLRETTRESFGEEDFDLEAFAQTTVEALETLAAGVAAVSDRPATEPSADESSVGDSEAAGDPAVEADADEVESFDATWRPPDFRVDGRHALAADRLLGMIAEMIESVRPLVGAETESPPTRPALPDEPAVPVMPTVSLDASAGLSLLA